LFAPFNARIKNYLGAKNTIVISFFFITISSFGFGLISHLNDPFIFKYTALFLQFIQGLSDVLLQITCYTIITSVFRDDITQYIVYIEIVVYMGLGIGPSIGSSVYSNLHFEGTMYLFAFFDLIGMIICILCIP
jgi:MFS family permease